MIENCRVTVTFITEFESDNWEVELALLQEQGEFEPLDLIKTCYNRGYPIKVDVYTERDL